MKIIIAVIVIILIGAGAYYFIHTGSQAATVTQNPPAATTTAQATTTATTTPQSSQEVIGSSVQGRPITAYHFGTGSTEVLFVGDIHGGYTPGTALLAYQTIAYLQANPDAVPKNETVTVIPVLNPDGLNFVVGTTTANFTQANIPSSQATQIAGRFNGDKVDLNRNFDCQWQPTAQWQGMTVSGGAKAFSEPESQAMQTYVQNHKPTAVVVWYASEGGVYTSSCGSAPLADTLTLTDLYATASGYVEHKTYSGYPIPGDMTNWLANIGIPTISVLLKSRNDSDWTNNEAGIKAVLAHYAQ